MRRHAGSPTTCTRRRTTRSTAATGERPTTRRELAGFRSLVDESGLRIGFAISPGLSMDESSERTAPTLARQARASRRPRRVARRPVPRRPATRPDPYRGAAGSRRTRHSRPGCTTGSEAASSSHSCRPSTSARWRPPYLDALARVLPSDVPIGWTGASVVNDEITADDARARARALGGRPPLLWDNVPVNDAVMSRPPLHGTVAGSLARAARPVLRLPREPDGATEARCSPSPRSRRGARATTRRPHGSRRPTRSGWRVFAEACDGDMPAAPRRGAHRAKPTGRRGPPLPTRCSRGSPMRLPGATRPGSTPKPRPWVDQTHAEATLAIRAVSLFRSYPTFVRAPRGQQVARQGPRRRSACSLARSASLQLGRTCGGQCRRVRPSPRGATRVASDLDRRVGVARRRDRRGRERHRRPRATRTRRGGDDRSGRASRDLRGRTRGRRRARRVVRGRARERGAGPTGERRSHRMRPCAPA